MAPTREPRLVLRFALASLLAFVLVAVGALYLLVRNARDRAELVGARHATFVGESVARRGRDRVFVQPEPAMNAEIRGTSCGI